METDQTGLTFRIMTLNLRFGRAEDGPNSWDNRKQRFIAFFEAHRPDFIGMQEVNDFQIDFLKKLLTEYHFIGQRSPAPDYWQDNLIFYKKEWKCGFHKRFFLSHTPSVPSRFAESKWPRQCVIGIFEKDGIMKLNSVVREMFYKHIPFKQEYRERLEKMPAFSQIANRYHNVHRREVAAYERKFKKYQDESGKYPDEIQKFFEYLAL